MKKKEKQHILIGMFDLKLKFAIRRIRNKSKYILKKKKHLMFVCISHVRSL